MKSILQALGDIVLSWLPFGVATSICHTALNGIPRANLQSWQPAFFLFFPTAFLFVGLGLYMNRRAVRQLQSIVAKLGLTERA